MQDTNFAGHLAEFAGQQDIKDSPAKSRTVGNYAQPQPHHIYRTNSYI